jgi:hypothetical protein
MGTEQQGNPRQGDELAALPNVADGIDPDRANHQAAGDVSLRRETHASIQAPQVSDGNQRYEHGPSPRPITSGIAVTVTVP